MVKRRAEVGGGHISNDRQDNITCRSEGPLAKCAEQTVMAVRLPRWLLLTRFGGVCLCTASNAWASCQRLRQRRNAAGRLLGGKPCEGEPHARFGKGVLETG